MTGRRFLGRGMGFLAAMIPAGLLAQPVLFPKPLSPRIANYEIEVKLDPSQRLLQGKETLTWRNASSDPVTELQFHLYLNAFRNSQSSFMKEAGKGALKLAGKDGWGFIEVKRIALASGEELTSAMEFIHPDDDNAADRTVFRLPLPKPLATGDQVVLQIDFTGKLPEPPIARNGAKKDYFFAGQWFPKVGVWMDHKWNCHQYHSHTEFFADFGVYNVKMTVPKDYLVGATGVEVSRTENGDGTATHFYHAEDVHDFAWTASPHFVEFTETVRGVKVRLLIQKMHAAQAGRHLEAAKQGIEHFADWYGPYPYPNLTVVDPARHAFESAGMEYPTLITAGTIRHLPRGVRAVEMVIIHEFGHQYWYHLVASNEFEDSWLDEGINTYSEIKIVHDIYPAKSSLIDFLGIKADDQQFRRRDYQLAAADDPIHRNAWQYYDSQSYVANSYSKPGMGLITLENYLGPETMNKIMRAYFERWKFRHPKTQDFVDVANEVAGQNLDWFFHQWLDTNAVLDYSVDYVSTEKVPPDKGYDYTLKVSAPEAAPAKPAEVKPEGYETKVKIRRLGDFQFPVEIEFEFQNGEKFREHWDGKDLWKEYRYLKPAKLVRVEVDPGHKVPLDIAYANNLRQGKKQLQPAKPPNEWIEMLKAIRNPN